MKIDVELESKKIAFKRTKNPVYLIEAFLLAYKAHHCLPDWLSKELARAFKIHHSTFGERSLDEILGFKKGYQGGHGSAYHAIMNEERDEMLMLDIFRLTLCGYSIEAAAHAVSQKLFNNNRWDQTGLKLKAPTGTTLERYYKDGHWNESFNYPLFKKGVERFLKRNKEKFLTSFSADSLPPSTIKKKPTKGK